MQLIDDLKAELKKFKFWEKYKIEWVSSTSSTNDDLKNIWRNNDFCPTLEVTDIQTHGKGQYNRKWSSDNIGQCLMFSFTLDTKEYKFPVSMIAGVALAKALESLGVNTQNFWLKWPNDIWIDDKKLAGILTESTTFNEGFRSVVGIGVNILPLSDKSINSVSLYEAGVKVKRKDVLLEFCHSWNSMFNMSDIEQAKIWNKYAGQFWKRKMKIQIPNEPVFIGIPLRVNEDGSLIVKRSNNMERKIISATLMPCLV